ncbi:bifunctional homocysteine S-methyltransferase/methylenetetrahydrofolate reductase [Paenibacillus aceti]|uniref:Bifunctional homocysteine S-methyltransferase/5,10-methylenetetrahydrofolate reductase n=1 Tax=Paenibacillus aceti TaxID=1820010 RepID=A0ABQ1VRF6_9BACL|nr:bifunctional homocysteine S-methyltransferase/methylenetetrahydrofolate reductase [Paenibacillus aceti]GGF87650.1 bifunctional homocysteine S-methyltransferase/5,10-methylenetetrahydrofolate reductase [Paenibacillus aceti]
MRPDLRQAWQNEVLIGDGALGTYMYQLGFSVGISYEEMNLTRPEVIQDVHRRYIDAGASLIETNTFSANYYKLSKFGLEEQVADINRAAVRIARQAAGADRFVAGAVGTIRGGKRINVTNQELANYFEEQMSALLTEDVDALILETFYDLQEMRLALGRARHLTQLPVFCQFAVDHLGRTLDGYSIEEAFGILQAEGADVLGFNCHSGPKGIMSVMEKLNGPLNIPLSVFPNAGLADYVDGEYVYGATPAYFGECAVTFADLGARFIGGCCGTTPEHIAAVARALEEYDPVPLDEGHPLPAIRESIQALEYGPKNENDRCDCQQARKAQNIVELVKERHTVIVELDPPRDLDIGKFMTGAAALKEAGIDALTLADNSLAVTRMSNMALGSKVHSDLGLRPLIHIACRDRNLIGTQSHMMGFDALGIDHILAVTGDPARFGDLPGASSVYDLTSFEIIRMIKQLNEGIAFSGKPLKHRANFIIGAAFNPNVKHLNKAVERLEKKIASGADYIMTQPVYNPELIVAIREATAHLDIPIFLGIMPLASGKNAEYLHNEVPGITLPESILKRMEGLQGAEGRAMGVEIAKELLDTALQHFNGIYLMTPFMFYEMTVALTNYVHEKSLHRASHLSRS